MQTYYTLSNAAGLIRSNKFQDQADAICVGTYRAAALKLPIKIYEHAEGHDVKCVLVCNPDQSVAKPKGAGHEIVELGNASSGARNEDGAFMLLSAYDEMPIVTFYLKSDLAEGVAAAMEKELGVEMGLYDSKTLHAYTEDGSKIKAIEDKLCEASIEIDRVRDSKVKKEKLEAAADLVEAARKGHKMARASRLPEMSIRASLRFGSGIKINCHCEMIQASNNVQKIRVYADGTVIGEVANDRDASRVIADYAERAFAKFLKKELA